MEPKTVLFACVHNAGRSQIAAAFFGALADPGSARALSAGTEPASHVHPEVLETMREAGFDFGGAIPRRLDAEVAGRAHLLVTMGCGDACPYVPGLEREDWPLPDPKGQTPERVREIRDSIRERVTALIASRGWGKAIVRPAHPGDLGPVARLLAEAALPPDGLEEQFADGYAVADWAGRIVAAAGVEVHGRSGLLRSVVTDPAWRGRRLGEALTRNRIAWARSRGLQSLYLLTTTAAEYFARLGFEQVPRGDAPTEIRASREFAQACPASAVFMRLEPSAGDARSVTEP